MRASRVPHVIVATAAARSGPNEASLRLSSEAAAPTDLVPAYIVRVDDSG